MGRFKDWQDKRMAGRPRQAEMNLGGREYMNIGGELIALERAASAEDLGLTDEDIAGAAAMMEERADFDAMEHFNVRTTPTVYTPYQTPGPVKDSLNNPLEVQYIEPTGADGRPVAGKLGRTICPGKKDMSGRNGPWDRNLDLDLQRLAKDHGGHILVTLMEADEMARIGVGDLPFKAETHGLRAIWYPIVDTKTPTDTLSFIRLVEKVVGALKRGRNVVVHCRGGIGRTGTLNACVLVALGYSPEDAIKLLREKHHKSACENKEQENFVSKVFPMLWRYTRPVLKRDARRDA